MSGYPGYLVFDAPASGSFLRDAVDEVLRARVERVERELRDLGECLWTDREAVTVVDVGGLLTVTPR